MCENENMRTEPADAVEQAQGCEQSCYEPEADIVYGTGEDAALTDEADKADVADEADVADKADEADGAAEAEASDKPDKADKEAQEPDEAGQADDKPAYDFGEAETRLLALQQQLRELGVPVVVVLEGWSAAGKGTMAGELLEGLDPRGYKVYVPERFSADEDEYPDMRRYWVNMPAKGGISLFIGSWYHAACAAAMRGKHARRELVGSLNQINLMEQMLCCDGVKVLKFFVNISKKEQKRRLKALEEHKATRGRVSKADWAQNERYDEWREVYNHMLSATDEPGAGWLVLPGKEKRECKRQLYTAMLAAFQSAIAEAQAKQRPWDVPSLTEHEPMHTELTHRLCDFDPAQTLDEDYKQALKAAQDELRKLQYELYRRRIPMVLAFEGWDAAGKGGAIRRLTSALDPRGFTVVPISAPTAEEKAHHHLWRFWKTIPKNGDIAIFDRTWYGRVMVERIEGFCTEAQWQRAYEEMNLFERDLTENGCIVRKFWLQISNDEQLKRFNARQSTPEKQWKITDEDWRNREKWPQYEQAVNDMLQKTNTHSAPWVVVEADNKQYARLKVLRTVIEAVKQRLNSK